MSAADSPRHPSPRHPWLDNPTCPLCRAAILVSRPDPNSGPLAKGWLGCLGCGEDSQVSADIYRRAVVADEWWERPDREQAWEALLRQERTDRAAADHAARQTSLFGDDDSF
jgi:hypothetical protein